MSHIRRAWTKTRMIKAWMLIFMHICICALVFYSLVPVAHAMHKDSSIQDPFYIQVQEISHLLSEQDYITAKEKLDEIDTLFTGLSFDQRTGVEGIEAISQTIIYLKYALTAAQLNPQEIAIRGQQLHLAADALFHEEQPLWKNSYTAFQQLLQKMEDSPDTEQRLRVWDETYQLYHTIRPALLVDNLVMEVNRLDSIFQGLRQLSVQSPFDMQQWRYALGEFKININSLFFGKDQATFLTFIQTPFSHLMIVFLSILLLCLTYVALRAKTYYST